MTGEAIILVGHGARDPAWAAPLQRLGQRLEQAGTGAAVRIAYLEFMGPDLPSALKSLCEEGMHAIRVVPVFLGAGGHVKRDIAACVEAARAARPRVYIELEAPVGERSPVIEALAAAIAAGG
ncbi:MAG: CbiX/SirB N-terminal domain-containing protein [Burkholderiales bacterium]